MSNYHKCKETSNTPPFLNVLYNKASICENNMEKRHLKVNKILQFRSLNFNPLCSVAFPIDHIRILSIGLELACNGG